MESSGKLYLFAIDDEPDQAYLLELAAQRCGVYAPVIVETDPESGLSRLLGAADRNEPLPNLILLDWKMPPLNGVELARLLRQRAVFRPVPIVVLSSSDFEDDRAAALAAGCRAFLQKPTSFSELVALLVSMRSLCCSADAGKSVSA